MSKSIRTAIESEIKTLSAELAKLTKLLTMLADEGEMTSGGLVGNGRTTGKKRGPKPKAEASKPEKKKKLLRLNDETRATIADKILKATKAHKDGATKADIIKYLDTSGFRLGVSYNEPQMFGMLSAFRNAEEPKITTTGDKSKMRYHAV